MKIVMLLTNAFDPDPRVYKEAKTLIENGHAVEILAWDRQGKFKSKQVEVLENIMIRRFSIEGVYGSGINQLGGYIKFIKKVREYLKGDTYSHLHCHDFDTLIIGYVIKLKNKHVNLIYDQHDLFHLYFENRDGWFNLFISKIIKSIEVVLLQKVDWHIVVTPNMKQLYLEKNIRTNNIAVITNAPLRESFTHIEKANRDKIVIGFIGSIRYAKELKVLFDVANDFSDIEILIAGRGTVLNTLKDYAIEKKYERIHFSGEYHLEELKDLYSQIDITYLVYPVKDAIVSMPNKYFESIATVTPMIADARAEFGNMIQKYGQGWIVRQDFLAEDLHKVCTALTKENILSEYKRNIQNSKDEFFWESNEEELLRIYAAM